MWSARRPAGVGEPSLSASQATLSHLRGRMQTDRLGTFASGARSAVSGHPSDFIPAGRPGQGARRAETRVHPMPRAAYVIEDLDRAECERLMATVPMGR